MEPKPTPETPVATPATPAPTPATVPAPAPDTLTPEALQPAPAQEVEETAAEIPTKPEIQKKPKTTREPLERGVKIAITTTVIIVFVLSALAVFAYTSSK